MKTMKRRGSAEMRPPLPTPLLFSRIAHYIAPALLAVSVNASGLAAESQKIDVTKGPLILSKQGSFFVGGDEVSQTATELGFSIGGHIAINQMYVKYMVPEKAGQNVPVVMIHGSTLSGKSYETTPDGRMGWEEYFVRKGHPVYTVDAISRARSGFDLSV
jgi:hypothetical protein